MLNEKFAKELEEKKLYLNMKPSIDLWQWDMCTDSKGKFWYPCGESQVYTEVLLDIVLEDEGGEIIDKVGSAQLWIINAHRFRKNTFQEVDGESGEMFNHLEALKYWNHERNYVSKGFDYPFQPFVILNRLFINEKYRGKGIGKSVIKNANKIVNDIFNLDTTILQWAAWPLADLHEVIQKPSEEDLKQLHKFARKVGAKTLHKEDDLKYFIYHYDELEGLDE